MKRLLISLLFLLLFIPATTHISAGGVPVAGNSAQLMTEETNDFDYRVMTLKNYLESHNSPLAEHAEDFVAYADENELDWRLVPAISGVESTFGKRIPYNSYNAYGWANGTYEFASWEESIATVSSTLKEKYIDKDAVTITQIARRYAPPSTTWAHNVKFFMNKIDPMPLTFTLKG